MSFKLRFEGQHPLDCFKLKALPNPIPTDDDRQIVEWNDPRGIGFREPDKLNPEKSHCRLSFCYLRTQLLQIPQIVIRASVVEAPQATLGLGIPTSSPRLVCISEPSVYRSHTWPLLHERLCTLAVALSKFPLFFSARI